jgi:hypothetical protein
MRCADRPERWTIDDGQCGLPWIGLVEAVVRQQFR